MKERGIGSERAGLAAQAQAAGGGPESGIGQGLGQRRVIDAGAVGALHGQAAQRAAADRIGEPSRRGDEHPGSLVQDSRVLPPRST